MNIRKNRLQLINFIFLFFALFVFIAFKLIFNNIETSFLGINKYYPLLILCLLFLVINGYFLFDKKYGISITNTGIKFKTSFFREEFIPWSSINTIEKLKTNQLKIVVTNPSFYTSKTKSIFQKLIYDRNFKVVGTPIVVSTNFLKINQTELFEILKNALQKNLQD